MTRHSNSTCRRCNGRGYLEIRLGLEGQDVRQMKGGYSELEWGPTYPRTVCNVCDGLGTVSRTKLRKGSYQIKDTEHHINSIECT